MARKQYTVTLARLVRETLTVTVDADSREEVEASVEALYELDLDGWEPDLEWGPEEGTHHVSDGVEVDRLGEVSL
jgi:hypothetical protein